MGLKHGGKQTNDHFPARHETVGTDNRNRRLESAGLPKAVEPGRLT